MPEVWAKATPDERDAVRALAHHIRFRFQQDEHEPLECGDSVFLSVSWIQGLLAAVGARRTGEKAAAEKASVPNSATISNEASHVLVWKDGSYGKSPRCWRFDTHVVLSK